MTREQFRQLVGREFHEINRLQETKGHDYAGDDDALSNFKRNGLALDLAPELVWAVYAGKHWDAIQTFCREGAVASEPIVGRLRDLIVYCLLLLAIVEEREEEEPVVS